jgi:hypothetical protein
MAHPPDRAAIDTRRIRDICRDISDRQAKEIEEFLRDEFAEVKAEVAAERPVED